MAIRKIAVLGAGNGGCAAAADLTLQDYEVRLYSRTKSTLIPIIERGGIELVEAGEKRFAKPRLVTPELAEAVAGAELIMIAAPAGAHEELVTGLLPYLRDGQIIFLNPGHTGGSLHAASTLKERGIKAELRIGETGTLTYICRLTGPARVEIYRRTAHLRCAAFPGKFTPELISEIAKFYPNVLLAENVLETGLSNINAIMHPAGMLGNAGWIENKAGDFYFYREGITPAIARLISAVDEERLNIVRKLGLERLSFVEIFYQAGLTSDAARASQSVYQAIKESVPNQSIKAPTALDHRYLHEDVGYGLAPMAEIARLLGAETPVIDSLITLASVANQVDYRSHGLTLKKMGLADVGAKELSRFLHKGVISKG